MKATLRYRAAFALTVLGLVAAYVTVILSDHGSRQQSPTVRVLVGEIPPMVHGDGRGVEIDYLRGLLDLESETRLEVTVFPFSRHWRNFGALEGYDLVMTVPEPFDLGGWNTAPYVEYANGLVYRRADFPDGLGPAPLDRLAGKRVVGFAGASRLIAAVSDNREGFALYLERYSQFRQAAMLASGLADAVIAERSIIEFYLAEVGEDLSDYVFEPVFCPTRYVMAARDGALHDRLSAIPAPVDVETLVQAATGRRHEAGVAVRAPGAAECLQ
ncbi:MAG: hypothetical protein NXI12_11395 [Alphaproteobacteria bacterium]|nr:hypothetical protein [Alphaproteobacteria bacterium]